MERMGMTATGQELMDSCTVGASRDRQMTGRLEVSVLEEEEGMRLHMKGHYDWG